MTQTKREFRTAEYLAEILVHEMTREDKPKRYHSLVTLNSDGHKVGFTFLKTTNPARGAAVRAIVHLHSHGQLPHPPKGGELVLVSEGVRPGDVTLATIDRGAISRPGARILAFWPPFHSN